MLPCRRLPRRHFASAYAPYMFAACFIVIALMPLRFAAAADFDATRRFAACRFRHLPAPYAACRRRTICCLRVRMRDAFSARRVRQQRARQRLRHRVLHYEQAAEARAARPASAGDAMLAAYFVICCCCRAPPFAEDVLRAMLRLFSPCRHAIYAARERLRDATITPAAISLRHTATPAELTRHLPRRRRRYALRRYFSLRLTPLRYAAAAAR